MSPYFANLSALWLGLSLPAILVLYLLKRRYQDQPVSSTFLWQRALRDLEASSPWQRLRRHLLLYLQLAAALLLVLAAVRPLLPSRAPTGDVIVVLDGSASMQATDLAPSRFEAARARTRALIDGLGRGDRMTLVVAAARPRVLLAGSRDRAALLRALAEAQVTSGTADLEEALKVSLAAVRGQAGGSADVTAIILSDGRVQVGSPHSWPMRIRYEQVGTDAGNLSVLAFSIGFEAGAAGTQAAVTGSQEGTLPQPGQPLAAVVRVANYGPAPVPAVVELAGDGQPLVSQAINLAPGEKRDLTYPDLPRARSYKVLIRPDAGAPAGTDTLAVDSVAYAVPPGTGGARALLVTTGNRFLERAISLYPGLELYRVAPAEYPSLQHPEDYSLVVFDGYTPEALPATNLWLVNPDRSTLLTVTAPAPVAGVSAARADEPLLRYVSADGWQVARARRINLGDWARPLLLAADVGKPEASETPVAAPPQGTASGAIAAAGETGGRRYVVFGFDLHDTDLPLRPAFPIMVQNLLGWLLPSNPLPAGGAHPGDLLQVTLPPGASQAQVETPGGEAVPLTAGQPFAATDTPGIYRLVTDAAGGSAPQAGPGAAPTREALFAVNAPAEAEGRLQPAPQLSLTGTDVAAPATAPAGETAGAVSAATVPAAAVGPLGRRELWPFLTLGALALLTLEWWVATRGH